MNRCLIQSIILYFILLAIIFNPVAAQEGIVMKMQWGEFGDKPGQFRYPAMIASDKFSNLYVVDQHNHRIQKFDKDGNFILTWGKKGGGHGEFNYPYGIAVDSKGNVYVSDMNNNRIQKFSQRGEFIASAGSYGTEDGQFKYPYGIAVDKNDFLYVVDAFNYRIQKFNPLLQFISKWADQKSMGFNLYMPHEIVISKDGNIILSDRQNHRISFFTNDGILIKRIGEFGEGREVRGNKLSEPHGVALNDSGEILVCDRYNFSILKFNSNGEFQVRWFTSGSFDSSRHFPLGITSTSDGSIYITDHYSHCIQKY